MLGGKDIVDRDREVESSQSLYRWEVNQGWLPGDCPVLEVYGANSAFSLPRSFVTIDCRHRRGLFGQLGKLQGNKRNGALYQRRIVQRPTPRSVQVVIRQQCQYSVILGVSSRTV